MKIGIIGSGNIGGALARLCIKAGHEVALSNSRGPLSLRDFVYELGGSLHPIDVDGAIVYGEIVFVAIPWRSLDSLPVFNVPGKIIIDTTNPFKTGGSLYDLKEISSTKVLQHFTDGYIVKAFNTIRAANLATKGDVKLATAERRVIPFAGDDKKAKDKVRTLIEQFGFGPLDTGTLEEGSRIQGAHGILFSQDYTYKEALSVLKDMD